VSGHSKRLTAIPGYDTEKNTPIMSLEERYRILRANRYVDAIICYGDEYESKALDAWLPVDVRFVGADHDGLHHDIRKGVEIVTISRDHDWSSSNLRKRICGT